MQSIFKQQNFKIQESILQNPKTVKLNNKFKYFKQHKLKLIKKEFQQLQ
jgi:hypothetical protein